MRALRAMTRLPNWCTSKQQEPSDFSLKKNPLCATAGNGFKYCGTAFGMEGAVTYAFLARLMSIAGSVGTVLLIVRFLSPVEQGYYYTLLSLASLQVVFELGFSFVIQQLAAHECVHLEFGPNGSVSGDSQAHARLASALQLSVRWYSIAAAAMALILAPLGVVFFSHFASGGQAHVAWQGPWLTVVLASSASLWCMPFYSFLEGCGHVREVAAMRFRQAAADRFLRLGVLLLHRGLYSPALVIVGQIVAGLLYVAKHRLLLAGLLRHGLMRAPSNGSARYGPSNGASPMHGQAGDCWCRMGARSGFASTSPLKARLPRWPWCAPKAILPPPMASRFPGGWK